MIILENNFWNKTTYIIGNYITNGCQTFHINNIDKVCKEFKVPDEIKKDVIQLHSKLDIDKSLQESLIHPDYNVRTGLARQAYALEILVNDESNYVRTAVASQGYALDVLISDKSISVRREVARQRYGLDILINDFSRLVRCEVARQGYGLETLINDDCLTVREVAQTHMNLQ